MRPRIQPLSQVLRDLYVLFGESLPAYSGSFTSLPVRADL